jgi:hypothetical protein
MATKQWGNNIQVEKEEPKLNKKEEAKEEEKAEKDEKVEEKEEEKKDGELIARGPIRANYII